MAYFILNPNETDYTNIYRIAANDTDKDNLNLDAENISVDVSDSDFNNLRNGMKLISSWDGTNYTFVDALPTNQPTPPDDPTSSPAFFSAADQVSAHINDVVEICNAFINAPNNASNPLFSSIESYKNYLTSFDTSTLSFPMTVSWEKYCEDNSISYYHPLQIP
ncbi:MAG: hypothetical protein HKN86_05040 [Acidimicrobiia bacterium]|nr:hypothetical protein [Acidimicrobiia bacterium]